MSQHIVVQEEKKFVFGWDQPLMSFYLQVHDTTRAEDDQIILWLGAGACGGEPRMYEVEDLVREARKEGLLIEHDMRVKLYGEKGDGR
jgi:hypothetical protein